MRHIYGLASTTIVWLGEETEKSAIAMKFVNELSVPDFQQILVTSDLTREMEDERWQALGQDIMKRSWWERVWVVQEVALSKNIIVLCGKHSVEWDKILTMWEFAIDNYLHISHKNPGERYNKGLYNLPVHMEKARKEMAEESPHIPLMWLIHSFNECLATDPRDMVYGLLGLATDDTGKAIEVDYRKPAAQVYIETADSIITNGVGRLDILCSNKLPKKIQGLPSWTPDLSIFGDDCAGDIAWYDLNRGIVYSACKWTQANFRFSNDLRVLTAWGTCVDLVEEIGDLMPDMSDNETDLKIYENVMTQWHTVRHRERTKRNDAYPTGGNYLSARLVTLNCDMSRRGKGLAGGVNMGDFDAPPPDHYGPGEPVELRVRAFREDLQSSHIFAVSRRRFVTTKKKAISAWPQVKPREGTRCVFFLAAVCLWCCEKFRTTMS